MSRPLSLWAGASKLITTTSKATMAENLQPLSHVLDQVESSVHGDSITIKEVTETLGNKSFSSLMLAVSLISTSPASAIPGVTATSGRDRRHPGWYNCIYPAAKDVVFASTLSTWFAVFCFFAGNFGQKALQGF